MAFEKYRERQKERSEARFADSSIADIANEGGKKKTPLGLDPVDPFEQPVDLTTVFDDEDADYRPTSDQTRDAEADFRKMVRGDGPEGFGDGLDKFV